MSRYTEAQSALQSENPAAPEGLQQEASKWKGAAADLSRFAPKNYAEAAQTWFGGRNTRGVNSGWDNEFMAKMFDSHNAYLDKVAASRKEKDPAKWLNMYDEFDPQKNPGAVGIARWNDPKGRFKVGDVVDNGRVVPRQNIYEVFDRDTANLMLAPFMFSAQEQARFNRDSERTERYEREVAKQAEKWTRDAEHADSALQYQADVYGEAHRIQANALTDPALTTLGFGGGAALGAGAGAAIGSVLPGPGTLVGAAIGGAVGGIVGGVGAYLNQDQLVEELARGRVQADRARDKYGEATAFTAHLTEYGGVARKAIAPLGNMLQGGYDSLKGGVGDGVAEFYRVDETGRRTVPNWMVAADLGAALGDGVLQFASPMGRGLYTASMGLTVAGGVGTMATAGAGFNVRTGEWDPYEGAEWAYAVGAIGIDALQMGVGIYIGKAAQASRAAFGGRTVVDEGFLAKQGFVPERARKALGVYTAAEAEAIIAGKGTREVVLGGKKFTIDASGRAVASRASMTVIVPSEALKWVGLTWRARTLSQAGRYSQGGNRVLVGGRPASSANRWVPEEVSARANSAIGHSMPGHDDYYRAALAMTTDSTFRTAMLNGYAEGYEEVVQAILEPLSFSERINPGEVLRAGMYGWASGVGMGIGARGASPEQKQFARAQANYMERKGILDMTRKEFQEIYYGPGMTDEARKRMAIPTKDQAEQANKYMQMMKDIHRGQEMGSIIPITALDGFRSEKFEQLHKNRNPNIGGSRVLMGMFGGRFVFVNGMTEAKRFAEDAAVQSMEQVVADLRANRQGLEVQEKALKKAVVDINALLADTTRSTEQLAADKLRQDEYTARLARYPALRAMSDTIVTEILRGYEAFAGQADATIRQRIVDQMNDYLTDAYRMRLRDGYGNLLADEDQELARAAVALRIARNPQQDPGASAMFLPQVSMVLTHLQQDATTYVHQGTLKNMGADHDGDQGVLDNALVLDQEAQRQLWRGAQYLQTVVEERLVPRTDAAGNKVKDPDTGEYEMVPLRTNRVTVVRDPADGYKTRIDRASDAMVDFANPARGAIVAKLIDEFTDAFVDRYVDQYPIFERDVLEEILGQFAQDITNWQYDAEQKLLDEMFNTEQAALLELADSTRQPEKSWMEGTIEQMWVSLQRQLAAQAGGEQQAVSSEVEATLPKETAFQEGVAKRDAAADGLTLTTLMEYMNDPVRMAQGLHYAPFYHSAVLAGVEALQGGFSSDRVNEFIALFAQLGAGQLRSALVEVTDKNPIEDRVVRWLEGFLAEAKRAFPDEPAFQNVNDGLVLLANLAVPDVEVVSVNEYRVGDRASTLLQVLLKKSIAIEEYRQAQGREDSDMNKRISRLKELATPEGAHSTTANRALMAVFGDVQMYRLAGAASDGVGWHLTPNQLMKNLLMLGPDARKDQANKWRRLPSMRPFGQQRHDPPYRLDEYVSRDAEGNPVGNINAFTMVMDAVIAEASAEQHAMEQRDIRYSKKFGTFHTGLRNFRLEWYRANHERLDPLLKGKDEDERKRLIFRDMVDNGPHDIAAMVADILPSAATLGIFRIHDNKLWTAKWLEDMLVHDDTAKAELMLFVHSRFAEFNAMGGKFRLDPNIELIRKQEKAKGITEESVSGKWEEGRLTPQQRITGIDPRNIKSRFLQMVYSLAVEDQTGYELDRLLQLAFESPTLHDFLQRINKDEPNWIGDMAPLLAYHDDVSTFEEDISDVWKAEGSVGQQQREAIRKAAIRMSAISTAFAKDRVEELHDRNLLADLEGFFTAQLSVKTAEEKLSQGLANAVHEMAEAKESAQKFARVTTEAGQLMRLMANAATYPDIVGPAAYDQFMAMVQQGMPRLHDKGKPPAEAEGIGQSAMSQLSMASYTSGASQELAALTSLDWQKVMANLTGLAKGPVRVMMDDGSLVEIDFTDPLNVVQMLRDPRTRAFAIAVLAPTQRDVDANNVVQHSTMVSTSRTDKHDTSLKRILADTTFGHLFSRKRLGLLTFEQAHQTLGMLDAAARASAVGHSEAVQAHADNPTLKIRNALLIGAMHHAEYQDRNKEALRRQITQNLGTVIQNLTLLDPDQIVQLKEIMHETLAARYLDRENIWDQWDMSRSDVALLDGQITQIVVAAYQARYRKIEQEQARLLPSAPQSEKDRLQEQMDKLQAKLVSYRQQKPLYERMQDLPPSVSSAIAMYTQHINDDSDLDNLADVRISLLQYLHTNNRIDRFVGKDSYRLARDASAILKSDPRQIVLSDKIKPDQWTELGLAAATTVLSESAAHFSSGVGLEPLVMPEEENKINRFYDGSWSFIVDDILDDQLLGLMRKMADSAKYERSDVDLKEIAAQMDNLLFSEKHLGRWTPPAVTAMRTAEHALGGATVTGAIQGPGGLPMEMRDVSGAAWMSYGMPTPYAPGAADDMRIPTDPAFDEHHGFLMLDVPHTLQTPGTFVGAINPLTYMKVEHHFVRSVKVKGPDGVVHNLTRAATDPWMRGDEVTNAGYAVFRGDLLQKHLEDLQAQLGEGNYQVAIEFVDVDKKPHDAEYVNSVLFDGAGPTGMAGMGPGPIAELFFGVGMINKLGQQFPLNYATKGGAAYRQIATTEYDAVVRGERSGASLQEILTAKALLMWQKEYETGTMPLGANNALYRLMKLRHVVRGQDAEGKQIYLWAEDVIYRETKGLPLPFAGPYQLIPLSTPVMQTLLGRSGTQGTKALTMPELNIENLPLPLSSNLNLERLEQLGLERLGETAVLGNTSFAAVTRLPPATSITEGRGKERVAAIKAQYKSWQGEIHEVHGNRVVHRVSLDTREISELNRGFLRDMTHAEKLATIMARMGIPYPEMHDMSALKLADFLEKSLDNIIGKNGMIWVYRHSETPDVTKGVLGRASMSSGFLGVTIGKDRVGPVHGDAIVLDLDDLLNNIQDGVRLNHDEALHQAKEIIRTMAERGVTVVLGAKSAQHLRSDLAQWMREGEVGYVPIKDSSHYFEPARIDNVTSKIVDALASMKEEVRLISPRGVQYRFVSDSVGIYASENATLVDYENLDQLRFKRVINVLLPASLTGSRISGRMMWNLPIRGEGQNDQWARLADQLGEQLDDPVFVEHLRKLSGGEQGNPRGVALIRTRADGKVTNGVRSFDDAIKLFKENLISGVLPTDTGQLLVAGDFYVAMSAKGEPLLLRYGFKIPDGVTLQNQLQAPMGEMMPTDEKKGEAAVGVGIAIAKLQEEQTVPPPIRVRRAFGDGVGFRIEGEYDTSAMTKDMQQQVGFKAGYTPMPVNWAFPVEPMSTLNKMRVTTAVSAQAVFGKQATNGLIRNLREAFVLTGIDFKKDLVDFLFGAGQRTEQQFNADWARAKIVLNEFSYIDWGLNMDTLELMLDGAGAVNHAQRYLNAVAASVLPDWTTRNFVKAYEDDPQDPTTRIATTILTTLMIPGIRPAHVIGTRGMLNVENRDSDALITMMPPFLTEALNNPRYKATREELFNRINANASWPTTVNPDNGETVPLYYLDPDFNFRIRMWDPETGEEMLEDGYLQRISSLPFEKDSASVAAAQISQRSNVSPHIATIGALTLSAWTALDPGKNWTTDQDLYIPNDLEEMFGYNDIKYFDTEESSFHEIFARVKRVTDYYTPWERKLPGQQKYLRDARLKMASYLTAIDKTGWSTDAETKAMEFLEKLNLKRDQLYEVDFLVRQFLGRPGAIKKGDDDTIDEQSYRQAVQLMIDNITVYWHPLHGGAVPMESESFWAKVFDAQRDVTKQAWGPEMNGRGKNSELAITWEQWVATLFQQTRGSNAPFHGMFRMDLDGFMHTYQRTTPTFNRLPLSMDTQRDLMLMDPDLNKYYLSLDPTTDALWGSPILLDSMDFTFNALTGHDSDLIRQEDAASTPASSIAEQLERQRKWLSGQKLAKQKPTSVRKYYQEGLAYIESSQETSNFFLALNHMHIIMSLANPGLFASAFLEVPYRNALEHMTNIASGRQISRGGAAISKVATKMGLKPKYTPEQVMMLRATAKSMGSKTEFRSELFGETVYKEIVHKAAPNRFNRKLEALAATTARLTGDPRLGMRGYSAALRYLEAALEFQDNIDSNISIEQLSERLMRDPLWLKKMSPESRVSAHSVGINRFASVRGMRQSAINKAALGRIDKWTRGDTAFKQWAGFLLSVPFRYRRFNIGTMLTMTGMTGFDQLFAMMRDQRPKGSIVGRLQAAMRGEQFVPTEVTDYSDVIEGVDLSRAFVKGGLTQTMMLAGGMWAGNLGLDGEDEEAKRRRRMTQYLNGAYLYDPRRAENDFLYADAMFLDSIPVLNMLFQDESGRSAIVPHWILRQFTSPLMGIQRFMNTGNLDEIRWGFQDAISAVPYSVVHLWDEAQAAADIMAVEAEEYQTENGDLPEAQSAVTQFIINVGAVYEKALLENSFVNGLRNGADEFDRDPYKAVQRDENGNIVYEHGLPVATSDLMAYRDDNDQVKQAYDKRSPEQARTHSYAENNFTFSLLASLISGQFNYMDSSFNRNNMAVKERKIELPTASQSEAEALVMSAFINKSLMAPQDLLTKDEIVRIRQNLYEDAGIEWDMDDLEAEAEAIYNSQTGMPGGLSIIDDAGNEVVTRAGARGIYQSLRTGAVQWDDAVLEGIVIPWEMRDQIASEWLEELMQWGVDQGMSEQGAQYYAKRIWYGDQMNPDAPGLKEILYDKRIPGEGTVKYNQLNMTYMIGPDGRPWATPFKKAGVLAAFGLPVPQRTPTSGEGMSKDIRGKSVDEVLGINTGLHGLVRKPTKDYEPPDDLFEKAAAKTYTPGNYKRYPRYARRAGGGGYTPSHYFDKMQPFPRGTAPDLPNIPFLNTGNPYIRRADVNRQRISSERERLKQWQ